MSSKDVMVINLQDQMVSQWLFLRLVGAFQNLKSRSFLQTFIYKLSLRKF